MSSAQGLHCLPVCIVWGALLYGKATLFKFYDNYSNFWGVQNFWTLMVVYSAA